MGRIHDIYTYIISFITCLTVKASDNIDINYLGTEITKDCNKQRSQSSFLIWYFFNSLGKGLNFNHIFFNLGTLFLC